MRNFLLGLVLTLAVSASVIVIIDRFQVGGDPRDIDEIRSRLSRIETALDVAPREGSSTSKDGSDGKASGSENGLPQDTFQKPLLPGGRSLSEIAKLQEETIGMLLDSEKALRRDLQKVYERILARLDELSTQVAAAGPATGVNDAAGRLLLEEKLKEMGVKIVGDDALEIEAEFLEPNRGTIEFVAVGEGGKAYEALFLTSAIPSAVKIGLEELGLVETDADESGKYPPDSRGTYIYVMWEALKKPRRLEDLILNRLTNETMERTPWMFPASYFYTDHRTFERLFAADVYRNVISLAWVYAPQGVLACPLEAADRQDDVWAPYEAGCPPPGTRVRIIIRTSPSEEWDKF
jgi:hypothetical protein